MSSSRLFCTQAAFGVVAAMSLIKPAFSADTVTLYGLLDAGVSYVSNQGGHHNFKFDDGIAVPSFFGLRGVEDLGGGLKAVFGLESQFTFSTGGQIAGGIFGRNAWVGLNSDHFGRITAGNQYDFMNDALTAEGNVPAVLSGGLYVFPTGPFRNFGIPNNPTGWSDWDRTAQEQIHNSVKYVSPSIGGFKLGAMYAFGGIAGNFNQGSAKSFGATYNAGNFGAGAAYTEVHYADALDTTVRNWGVGTHYGFGSFHFAADFTTGSNRQNGASAYQGSIGGQYYFAPDVSLGTSYTYMKGNAELENAHANQVALTLNYILSKRTQVYLSGVTQHASSGSHPLFEGLFSPNGADASSSQSQSIVRVGIRTAF